MTSSQRLARKGESLPLRGKDDIMFSEEMRDIRAAEAAAEDAYATETAEPCGTCGTTNPNHPRRS
jgi:hypothetical protein